MDKNEIELEVILDDLNSSKTEESILDSLVKLVKKFDVETCQGVINSNPYYKSLLPDVKKVIINEIQHLKESIINEIKIIDNAIENGIDVDEFKKLKKTCESLLSELYKKEEGYK